jgi:hypothetical protein
MSKSQRPQTLAISHVMRERDQENADMQLLNETSENQHQEIRGFFKDPTPAKDDYRISRVLENETLLAVNHQTSGTEFYGPSSNFVSLNKLLSKARQLIATTPTVTDLPDCHPVSSGVLPASSANSPQPATVRSHSTTVHTPRVTHNIASIDPSQTPLSVVNLLCDETASLPDPRPASPVTVAGRAQKQPSTAPVTPATIQTTSPHGINGYQQPDTPDNQPMSNPAQTTAQNSSDCFFGNPMSLEIEYVNLYFHNLHNILPFLDPYIFKARCEREIWATSALKRLRRNQMHFLALYNAVLAVGALTAPTDALESSRTELGAPWEEGHPHGQKVAPSSIRLSKLYFQRARRLLGDVFETCSLEGSQTLLLLVCLFYQINIAAKGLVQSIYCQHALRPHTSYMYSGMAVRTGLAVGITSTSRLQSEESQVESARTWW